MVKCILGVILAAVIIFFWGFIFWGLSPLPDTAFKQTPDDRSAGQSLLTHFPVSGTYFIPGMHNDDQTLNDLMRSGPIAHIHIQRQGQDPMSSGSMMLGFLHFLVSAILIALLLYMVLPALPTYGSRVIFVAMAGLAGAFFVNMGNPIWWHHSWSWTWLVFVYDVITWLVAGLVLAAFIKPKPAEV